MLYPVKQGPHAVLVHFVFRLPVKAGVQKEAMSISSYPVTEIPEGAASLCFCTAIIAAGGLSLPGDFFVHS
jgi:hypothetical protein